MSNEIDWAAEHEKWKAVLTPEARALIGEAADEVWAEMAPGDQAAFKHFNPTGVDDA